MTKKIKKKIKDKQLQEIWDKWNELSEIETSYDVENDIKEYIYKKYIIDNQENHRKIAKKYSFKESEYSAQIECYEYWPSYESDNYCTVSLFIDDYRYVTIQVEVDRGTHWLSSSLNSTKCIREFDKIPEYLEIAIQEAERYMKLLDNYTEER